jgi:hypothetical protein
MNFSFFAHGFDRLLIKKNAAPKSANGNWRENQGNTNIGFLIPNQAFPRIATGTRSDMNEIIRSWQLPVDRSAPLGFCFKRRRCRLPEIVNMVLKAGNRFF